VTLPQFELPTYERRMGWGWILLGLTLLLLISGSLAQYFGRNPYETALRTYLVQSRAQEALREDAGDLLEPSIRKLAGKRGVSKDAALYYFVMRYEQTGEVDRESLSTLKTSGSVQHKAVAEAYESHTLTAARARRLAKMMDDSPLVVYQLAAHRAKEKAGLVKDEDVTPLSSTSLVVAGAGIVLCMLIGGGLLLAYGAVRLTGQARLLGSPAGVLTAADADRYALRSFHILLVYIGVSVVVVLTPLASVPDEVQNVLLYVAILMFTLLVLPFTPVGGKRLSLSRLGITTENLSSNILWGIGGAFAAFPMAILAVMMMYLFPGLPPPEHPMSIELEGSQSLLTLLLLFFMGAVAAPIWEEICFRGLMLPAMASLFRSPVLGVLISSFCFAAIHPTGIPAWPTLAAVGAIGAILTYQRRSLVPSIVMHAVYNFTLLLVSSTLT
jgi:membrane protease YdiL (CAAX protease family)